MILSMLSKREVLKEIGFKPAGSLEEILGSNFLIDSGYGSDNDIAVYAVKSKAEVKDSILYLNGTTTRYFTSTNNLKHVIKDDYVPSNPYSFKKEHIEKGRLWVLNPEFNKGHPNWKAYIKERTAFLRRYMKDMKKYSTLPQASPPQK
jgi:hypothetical protein